MYMALPVVVGKDVMVCKVIPQRSYRPKNTGVSELRLQISNRSAESVQYFKDRYIPPPKVLKHGPRNSK